MAIEICTVGGYNEVGKNMLAVKVDDDFDISAPSASNGDDESPNSTNEIGGELVGCISLVPFEASLIVVPIGNSFAAG